MGFYGNSIIINEVSKEKASEDVSDSIIKACKKVAEKLNADIDKHIAQFKDSKYINDYKVVFYDDKHNKELIEKNTKTFKNNGSFYFFGAFEFPKNSFKNGSLNTSNIKDDEEKKVFNGFASMINKAVNMANSDSTIKKYGEVYVSPNNEKEPNRGYFVFQYKK